MRVSHNHEDLYLLSDAVFVHHQEKLKYRWRSIDPNHTEQHARHTQRIILPARRLRIYTHNGRTIVVILHIDASLL